jgi:plasmid stabilization system protein ParE
MRRFRNYLIYYRVLDDRVELVRAVHGARDQHTALEGKTSQQ